MRRESTEGMLQGIIATVEIANFGVTGPESRLPGTGKGLCWIVSRDIVERARAERIPASIQPVFEWAGKIGSDAPAHWVALVGTPPEDLYIADPKIFQYENPDGPLHNALITTGTSPLKEQLRRDGYFLATEDNLNAYLDLLRRGDAKLPIRRLTVEDLGLSGK